MQSTTSLPIINGLLTNYMASQPKKLYSSWSLLWEPQIQYIHQLQTGLVQHDRQSKALQGVTVLGVAYFTNAAFLSLY
jgi:hypothetical protein